MNELDDLEDIKLHIPLYKHLEPQTKDRLFDLWKQSIKQILRNLVDETLDESLKRMENMIRLEVKASLKEIESKYNLQLDEIAHIRTFEEHIYKETLDLPKIKKRLQALETTFFNKFEI